MANELKPCPFCHKTSYLKIEMYLDPSFEEYHGFTVVCSAAGYEGTERGCGSSGGWGETEAGAATAWNTRPAAPVEGLIRYDISMFGNGAVEMGGGEYVRFEQAEAIIAAKDKRLQEWQNKWAQTDMLRLKAEADNAALTARVKELGDERYKLAYAITGGEDAPGYLDSLSVETLVEVARENTQHWFAETDRADKAETKLAACEKQLSKDRKLRNEAQCDADLWRFSADMGDHPSLLVKVWRQRKALETQLAAARKALEGIAGLSAIDMSLGDQVFAVTSARAALEASHDPH
ncbi:Lar family restriction alleviation protein [Brucella sp. TWI559]